MLPVPSVLQVPYFQSDKHQSGYTTSSSYKNSIHSPLQKVLSHHLWLWSSSCYRILKNILGATIIPPSLQMHSKADDKTSGDESKSASVQEVFRSGTPSVEQSQRQVL